MDTLELGHLDELIEGLVILGTGGGGDPILGRLLLENDLLRGRYVKIVDYLSVPDEAFVATGGLIGSVTSRLKYSAEELVDRWENNFELERAFDLLEKATGKTIDYIVPFELGGSNMPIFLSLGARTGRNVINGDGLGRAAPETHMVSFHGYGVALTPMALIDFEGDEVVIQHQNDHNFADSVSRFIVTRWGGKGANAHHLMTGIELKKSVIPNTFTKAIELGKAVIHARNVPLGDPIQAVVDSLGGWRICSEKILQIKEENWEGFYYTTVKLTGGYVIQIKNEAMALFVGNKLLTIFPDLICMLDSRTAQGLLSKELCPGMDVTVIVAPCHERLRSALTTSEGIAAFSPTNFGMPGFHNVPVDSLLRDWTEGLIRI